MACPVERAIAVLDRFCREGSGIPDWCLGTDYTNAEVGVTTWYGFAVSKDEHASVNGDAWEIEAHGSLGEVLSALVSGVRYWCVGGSDDMAVFDRMLLGVAS
jgi:hypothetical protein